MKKIIILNILVGVYFTLFASTRGTDNNAVNKEISKILLQIAPNTKKFKWRCETISVDKIPFTDGVGKNTTKKCIVDTDIGITLKVTCKNIIVSANISTTECITGGW